jgi:hypothetical protein
MSGVANRRWKRAWILILAASVIAGCASQGDDFSGSRVPVADGGVQAGPAVRPVPADGSVSTAMEKPYESAKGKDGEIGEIIVPEGCLPPGKPPEKPSSFQIINKGKPECAEVERALRTREQSQWGKEIKARQTAKWEQIKKEYRRIEVLEPPVITRPTPKVTVKDLGSRKAPKLQGKLLEAFSGADERYHYLVTTDSIYVMGQGDRVVRRIAKKKGTDAPFHSSGVRWSADARWFWHSYVIKEEVPEGAGEDAYSFARTDVYDKTGTLWWSLKGMVASISPDGRRAAIEYSEGAGLGYIEKGWEESEALVGSGGFSSACVFDDFTIVVAIGSPSMIVTLNREGKVVGEDKVLADCTLPACVAQLGRAFIECSVPSVEKAQLMMLDAQGKVLAKIWFPSSGNILSAVDWKKKHLLVGVDTGESVYLDLLSGEALHQIGRVEGVEQPIPLEEFKGTRSDHFLHSASLVPIIRKRPLVYRLLLLDDAVLRLRRPYDSNEKEGQKRPILEIVNLAGKVLYSQRIELDRPNALPYGELPLPIVWKEKGAARILNRGKAQTIEVVRGVE